MRPRQERLRGNSVGKSEKERTTGHDIAPLIARLARSLQERAIKKSFLEMLPELREAGSALVSMKIEEIIHSRERSKLADLSPAKQALVKKINRECRSFGLVIAHPESGEPCTLIAINDKWGGKFALENRKTKKRSRTARDIRAMLPFKLIALPVEEL